MTIPRTMFKQLSPILLCAAVASPLFAQGDQDALRAKAKKKLAKPFVTAAPWILDYDKALGTLDLLVRWGKDGGHCTLHRHLASTTCIVLQGEQHFYDYDAKGVRSAEPRIRGAGEHGLSMGPDKMPHMECGGPDGGVAFFSMHGETQAAATCLVLACSQAIKDNQVAEWATRAFFLYGGEPRLHYTQQPGNPALQGRQMQPGALFHPQLVSTPAPHRGGPDLAMPFSPVGGGAGGMPQQQHILGAATEIFYSAKHNGLYLYFSRLVRPIWLATLVVTRRREGGQASLQSSVESEELDWIMTQLNDLNAFLERNAQFTAVPVSGSGGHHDSNPLHMHQHKTQQEALLRS